MSTIDDINAARDAALQTLQQKIDDATNLRNGGATGLDATIVSLRDQRTALATQAYEAALSDPEMIAALAALKAASAEMDAVAAKMVSATTFITNVASLGTATNKVVSALKGTA
jgi:hypothetical protein